MTPSTSPDPAKGLADVMAAANPGWTHEADEGVVTSTPTILPGDEVRLLPQGRWKTVTSVSKTFVAVDGADTDPLSRRVLVQWMAEGRVEWRRPAEGGDELERYGIQRVGDHWRLTYRGSAWQKPLPFGGKHTVWYAIEADAQKAADALNANQPEEVGA